MRVCTECGWRFDDDRETCLICGGEVVPGGDLFLPPPRPVGWYLDWVQRRLRPLRWRFRRWIAEADVADREGGSFLLWSQDLRATRPWIIALIALTVAFGFGLLFAGGTLFEIVRAWFR